MDDILEVSKEKLLEIAKLENLKILSLRFYDLDFDDATGTSTSTIFELLGSLPKLQELQLNFEDCQLIEGGAKKRFSTAFPCLKVLRLSRICLENGMKLLCAFELIRSSPNLHTLEITASNRSVNSPSQVDDYNTMGMLQLRSVMFECLKGSENELRLIKYLLACSPFLERIVIYSHSLPSDEKLKFASS